MSAYFLLLLNAALWGFSPPIIKHALGFVSPITFLFIRYFLAALLFFPFFIIHKVRNPKQHEPKHLILLALLGTPLTLFPLFLGLQTTTSIEASILESASPVFIILGSLVYLKETVRPKEWLGIILALFGTLLITLRPLFSGQSIQDLSIQGNILILLSGIIWSSFLILAKRFKADPVYLTFTSFVVSIPFFLLLALITKSPLIPHPLAVPGILYMTICGSIIAFWAYTEGQKRIGASQAAIFSYLKPVFTLPLSYFWLKEPLSLLTIVATIIIILGVYISELK